MGRNKEKKQKNNVNKNQALAVKYNKELAPSLVKKLRTTEDLGTAMLQTAQEYTLAIEDILIRKFNFKEGDLQLLEKELIDMLFTLAKFERDGFSILNPRDMKVVGEIAAIRYKRLSKEQKGKLLPPAQNLQVPEKAPSQDIVEELKSEERKKKSEEGKVVN